MSSISIRPSSRFGRRALALAGVATAVAVATAPLGSAATGSDGKTPIPKFGLRTQGVTKDSVKLGVTQNFSKCGQTADIASLIPEAGGDPDKAFDAFVEYINDTGGIEGRELILVKADDGQGGCDEKAGAAVTKLVDDEKVFMVIPGLHAVSQYSIKKKIPTMIGRDDPASLKKIGSNGIGLEPPIADSLEAWASFGKYYLNTAKHTPCLIHPDNPDWNSYEKILVAKMKKYGLKFAAITAYTDDFNTATQQASTGAQKAKDVGCDQVWFMDVNAIALLPMTNAAKAADWFPTWTFSGYAQLADSDLVKYLDQDEWKNSVGLSFRVPAGKGPNEGTCKKVYEKYAPGDNFGGSAYTQLACAQILGAAEIMRRAVQKTGKLTGDSALVGADSITNDWYPDAIGPLDWKFPGPKGPFKTKGFTYWTPVKWNPDTKHYDFPEYPEYWKVFKKGLKGGIDITTLFNKEAPTTTAPPTTAPPAAPIPTPSS